MPWVKLDDGLHSHPKVLAAGLAATGLFCRALSYCGAYLTDGYVPEQWVRGQLAADEEYLPQRLVDVGLWVRDGERFHIPDYLTMNPSRERVQADRAAGAERAERSRKAREAKAASR